ncbi:thiamine pyrophosphate-dependent enzyme, partial [Actinomadura citrea]|uniref:thiamine pyrophosphate-dependent enzyme n=1 Tax=Actinomadura citrea TaxID=46158 RepID=UPI003CE4C486
VARADAVKLGGLSVVADAREGIRALEEALAGYTVPQGYRERARALMADWNTRVERACAPKDGDGGLLTQAEVIGAVNEVSGPRDVVVCAAGSMPGDLHKLWRARDPKGYHVEYGYSCMGYEIAGGLGVKMAAPDREVFVLVGDGSYLMMAQELTTAAAEGIKLVVVLVQNHGYASIGNLSESVGAQRFGTRHRLRTPTGLDGDPIPLDLAANAASLGADVIRAATSTDLRDALQQARKSPRTTVVHIETDPLAGTPDSAAWWDVPVAEVSALDSTREARARYERDRGTRRHHL